jgi:predicted enzyme related to lactoylglutathione lyase
VRTPTFSVAVITLPASDVERALRFYIDQVGFTLDVDYSPTDAFRVVQLTPPGSSCSIQIGNGLTNAPVGSLRNVYLVVTDLEAAQSRLLQCGVAVGEIRHKTRLGEVTIRRRQVAACCIRLPIRMLVNIETSQKKSCGTVYAQGGS